MTAAFLAALLEAAAADDRVWLLTADVALPGIERFRQRFPDRCVELDGRGESLIDVAVGVALSRRVVFVCARAADITLRWASDLRMAASHYRADVKVVGLGAGIDGATSRLDHHVSEDLAIARSLSGVVTVVPGDPEEVRGTVRALIAEDGVAYVRLDTNRSQPVHRPPIRFALGEAIEVRDGRDLTLVATGGMLPVALQVAGVLSRFGAEARVLSMHTLRPLDVEAIQRAAAETHSIVTLEEHVISGGLGGAVCEVVAERGEWRVPVHRIGLPAEGVRRTGTVAELADHYGLTAGGVLATLKPLIWGLEHARDVRQSELDVVEG